MKKVVIKQSPEKEVPVEVMAQAVVDLSRAAKRLLNGPLKRDAIIVLIKDKTNLTKGVIAAVLDQLEDLERTWVRK